MLTFTKKIKNQMYYKIIIWEEIIKNFKSTFKKKELLLKIRDIFSKKLMKIYVDSLKYEVLKYVL